MFIEQDLYNQILQSLPITCIDLLIIHNNQCLMLLRNNEPALGQYWFPGGRLNKNELISEGTVRKAKQEVNLDCTFEKIVSVEETIFPKNERMLTTVHTVNICCLLHTKNIDSMALDKFHTKYKWISHISQDYHPGVINPLKKIGFDFL